MKAENGKIVFDKEDVKLIVRIILNHAEENTYGSEWQDNNCDYIFANDFCFGFHYTARYYGGYYRPETYNRSYGVWEPEEYDDGELQFSDYGFDCFFDEADNEYTSEQTNIEDFYEYIDYHLNKSIG